MNLTTPLTNAAHRVTERLSHLASDALRSTRGSLFAIGTQVLDAMLDRIATFVGAPDGESAIDSAMQHEPLEQPVHGKAAGKKRKQARMAMQQLIKAAKRTPQAAYRRRQR